MNYKEQSEQTTLQKWWRASSVFIDNPYAQVPQVSISEQEITKVGDEVIKIESVGGLHCAFDPTFEIALRDVETGQLTGSVKTMGEIHACLWSLYQQLAEARDLEQ